MRSILYIEACNFKDFPLGGTLSFAKQLIQNDLENFSLVGLGESDDPIGSWFSKEINGKSYEYYAIGKTSVLQNTKLPKRMGTYWMLKKHLQNIFESKQKVNLVFSQTPEFVFLISKYKWDKFCFCFAGLGNSIGNSKFKLLRIFGGIYEKKLFNALQNSCDVILAAADEEAINEKIIKYDLKPKQIISFPTRFDKNIFYPRDPQYCREKLQIKQDLILLVTTGRLSHIKGWRDLIESFRLFQQTRPNSKLVFIGDGEDKDKILDYGRAEIENGSIELVGRKPPNEVAIFLNAANIFVMFSRMEGWPTAMVEAIACGKNVVTSKVSGTTDMINSGENGYEIINRNINDFANAIEESLSFPYSNPVSISISNKFSSQTLYKDFYNLTK